MPYARPTRTSLIQQVLTDIATALGLRAVLRFRPEYAVGQAAAGLTDGLHGHLDWIARQAVPATATDEYLVSWAALVGVTRKPATPATGTATFVGTPGAILPAGTLASLNDGSATYAVVADVTVPMGGTVTALLSATVPGTSGNAPLASALSLIGAVPGITSAGAASTPLVGGADEESNDAFRTRMLLRWAAPPQGGDAADYLTWALAVPGVTRAWVNPHGAGAGTVVVYTMWDDADPATSDFPQGSDGVAAAESRALPASGEQLAVADAIYPLRPVTALVYSVAPVAYPVEFRIHAGSPVAATVKANVLVALDEVFLALASPLAASMETSPFANAIAAVPGMPAFTLVSPASLIAPPLGFLPIRGPVLYV